jgi:hypothetical protein
MVLVLGLTHQMIKHGYFLLIIKRNLKLNLEEQMLLPMGIGVIIYYQRLEVHMIYALMKMVTKILQVIQI